MPSAIVLGMLAARAPWAPIVAFMVASPLTSPEELFLSAGLFGWPFALLFYGGTIVLGFAAGAVASLLSAPAGSQASPGSATAPPPAIPVPPPPARLARLARNAPPKWMLRNITTGCTVTALRTAGPGW